MFSQAYSGRLFDEARALCRKLEMARARLGEAYEQTEHMPITRAAPHVLEAERDIQILENSLRYGYGVHSFPAGSADA